MREYKEQPNNLEKKEGMLTHENVYAMQIAFFALLFAGLLAAPSVFAASVVAGRIVLDVEQHGEAWYVLPSGNERVFLGRPDDAFRVMRDIGLGIRSAELSALPPALVFTEGEDTDFDGLSDSFEEALGTNPEKADSDGDGFRDKEELAANYSPLGKSRFVVNKQLLNRLKGRILLQVEGAGQAWYVNPVDGKRYFLGRPGDAFRVMRDLGLGVAHANLLRIAERGTEKFTPPAQTKTQTQQPYLIDIKAQEFSFAPYSTSVAAGKPLRITLKNAGAAPHNLIIEKLNIGTPTIAHGDSAVLDVNPLEAGIYTLYCSVPGHREKGMEAHLKAI